MSNYRNTTIGFGVEPQARQDNEQAESRLRDKLAVIGMLTVLQETEEAGHYAAMLSAEMEEGCA